MVFSACFSSKAPCSFSPGLFCLLCSCEDVCHVSSSARPLTQVTDAFPSHLLSLFWLFWSHFLPLMSVCLSSIFCVEMGLQHVSLLMLACPGRHLGSGMLLFSVPTSVFTSLIFFFKGAMDFMILFSFYDDQKRDNAGCGFSLLSVSRSLIIWYCSSQKPAERFLNKNIISCYFHGFLFNVYHF